MSSSRRDGMGLEHQTVRSEIRDWVIEASLEPGVADVLEVDTDMVEAGIIDSFGMLDLLTWIEDRYGVFIEFAGDDEVLTQTGQLADRVVALSSGSNESSDPAAIGSSDA